MQMLLSQYAIIESHQTLIIIGTLMPELNILTETKIAH